MYFQRSRDNYDDDSIISYGPSTGERRYILLVSSDYSTSTAHHYSTLQYSSTVRRYGTAVTREVEVGEKKEQVSDER